MSSAVSPGAPEPLRIAVIGAGIAGLAAARRLHDAGHSVLVLEAAPRIGGKLLRAEVAGVGLDVGAEAMLARRPEGVELAASLGLEVVHPTAQSARLWTRGALRPLPRSVMGIPLDLDELAASGVLSGAGLAEVRAEPGRAASDDLGADISVGELVDHRLGREVTDRLVEPLLGGVYAGRARELSARAAVPQLLNLAGHDSLLEAAAALPTSTGPVFGGLVGGMAGLSEALADGLDVRMSATVRSLRRIADGPATTYELEIGPSTAVESLRVDAVVIATPAAPTARLLADLSPAAATELAGIEYASMAIVTLALPLTELPAMAAAGSGFLVPPVDGRSIKASTLSSAKWDWVGDAARAADVVLLRTSLGRHREEAVLQRSDAELVRLSLDDLADALGTDVVTADPIDSHVQRWGGALPQYAVGHLERVARVRSALARLPRIAVCGAAYDGVGIPAVIASADRAAEALLSGERSSSRSAPD